MPTVLIAVLKFVGNLIFILLDMGKAFLSGMSLTFSFAILHGLHLFLLETEIDHRPYYTITYLFV